MTNGGAGVSRRTGGAIEGRLRGWRGGSRRTLQLSVVDAAFAELAVVTGGLAGSAMSGRWSLAASAAVAWAAGSTAIA